MYKENDITKKDLTKKPINGSYKKTKKKISHILRQLDECVESCGKKRDLDDKIDSIQKKLKYGTEDENNEFFQSIYSDFKGFIKNQTSLFFLIDGEQEDLIQESTICFYKAILNYNKSRGAFVYFAKLCIRRNIMTLINKSQKHKKYDVKFISLNGMNEDENNNFDDYLYYNSENNQSSKDSMLSQEEFKEILEESKKVLTKKESNIFGMYLIGKTYKDIANCYNTDEKSVDNALHRAKSKLKNIITEV